jgi:AraC-like DNA-binding protein
VLGHERAFPTKFEEGRLWKHSWGVHICVKGKGYYNGQPIQRGSCFISWPNLRHSIKADAKDPFEFYWLILRGDEIESLVQEYGFRNTQPLFICKHFEEIVGLFELGLKADYEHMDIHEYTMGLLRMILSYHKKTEGAVNQVHVIGDYDKQYVSMAKNLLHDSHYSLSVEEVSRVIGLNAKYFSRVFRRETGESVKEYITRKRFKLAEQFLKKGMPPVEVARTLGYLSYTSFYTGFVKATSVTPKQYIEGLINTKAEINLSEEEKTK